MILFVSMASAATLEVGVGHPHATIGSALASAVAGDLVLVHPGSYVEDLVVDTDVTIRGAAVGVTIHGVNAPEAIAIDDATVTIESLAIDGSGAHGIEVDASSTLTVRDIELYGSTIGIRALGDLVIEDATIRDNDGEAWDGAVHATGDTLEVRGSTFLRNSTLLAHPDPWSGWGGAISAANARRTVIEDNWFEANASRYAGGAVYVTNHGKVRIERNTFCANTSVMGGAVAIENGGTERSRIRNNVFQENAVEMSSAYGNANTGRGGAIFADGGGDPGADIFANTFVGNEAENGGAHVFVRTAGSTFHLNGNLFSFGSGSPAVRTTGAAATGDYNAWWSNSADVAGSFAYGGSDVIGLDPLLGAVSLDGDCTNDDLSPGAGSPLIDASDPRLVDPDGTVADIGHTGG